MYAEYPMIRFLEENGYDVSYTSGVDMSQPGAASIIEQHKIFLRPATTSTGPAQQRANVQAAMQCGRQPGLLHRQRGVLEDQV